MKKQKYKHYKIIYKRIYIMSFLMRKKHINEHVHVRMYVATCKFLHINMSDIFTFYLYIFTFYTFLNILP